MVYLPTFTIKINDSWIGKYNSPIDPMGMVVDFYLPPAVSDTAYARENPPPKIPL